jgi:hypothetical protein
MNIGRKFNTLTVDEYFHYIDNHKAYKDFNTLGLYRSIVENEKLSIDQKIAVRDHAHQFFKKAFDFLQLKDPKTYVEVQYLGQELTKGDEHRIWNDVRRNQQRILEDKEIKHRNFGVYSKHNCGYDTCVWNGIMIKQGSWLMESNMHFDSDKRKYSAKSKSDKRKAERKREKQIIGKELENE